MEIRLLKNGYKKSERFYNDFLEDQIRSNDDYFSGDVVYIDEAPDFPIYMGRGSESEKKELFIEAVNVISKYYLKTDRDVHFDELFWHSLFTVYKREYLLEKYQQIKEGKKEFDTVVVKNFDWQNYIYKCVLAAQYVNDNVETEEERQRYYELIFDNLDLYNYIIKYEIFRNDKFLLNILDIIDELKLTKVMKAKVKNRPDLAKEERVGRRVIFEFNKSYPIILSPMLDKESLKIPFLNFLSYYYDLSKINEKIINEHSCTNNE